MRVWFVHHTVPCYGCHTHATRLLKSHAQEVRCQSGAFSVVKHSTAPIRLLCQRRSTLSLWRPYEHRSSHNNAAAAPTTVASSENNAAGLYRPDTADTVSQSQPQPDSSSIGAASTALASSSQDEKELLQSRLKGETAVALSILAGEVDGSAARGGSEASTSGQDEEPEIFSLAWRRKYRDLGKVREIHDKLAALPEEEKTPEIRNVIRRLKISLSNTGKKPWNTGRKHSAETLERIRAGNKQALERKGVTVRSSGAPRIRRALTEEQRAERERKKAERAVEREQKKAEKAALRAAKREADKLQRANKPAAPRPPRPPAQRAKKGEVSQEHRRAIAEAIKKLWEDPDYRAKVVASKRTTPRTARKRTAESAAKQAEQEHRRMVDEAQAMVAEREWKLDQARRLEVKARHSLQKLETHADALTNDPQTSASAAHAFAEGRKLLQKLQAQVAQLEKALLRQVKAAKEKGINVQLRNSRALHSASFSTDRSSFSNGAQPARKSSNSDDNELLGWSHPSSSRDSLSSLLRQNSSQHSSQTSPIQRPERANGLAVRDVEFTADMYLNGMGTSERNEMLASLKNAYSMRHGAEAQLAVDIDDFSSDEDDMVESDGFTSPSDDSYPDLGGYWRRE